jgi:hypothetical protein
LSAQFPYAPPPIVQPQGEAHVQASGAVAQPHDFGAEQVSPQHDAQPDEKIAIPAETTPAANRLSAEFFMPPLYQNSGGTERAVAICHEIGDVTE